MPSGDPWCSRANCAADLALDAALPEPAGTHTASYARQQALPTSGRRVRSTQSIVDSSSRAARGCPGDRRRGAAGPAFRLSGALARCTRRSDVRPTCRGRRRRRPEPGRTWCVGPRRPTEGMSDVLRRPPTTNLDVDVANKRYLRPLVIGDGRSARHDRVGLDADARAASHASAASAVFSPRRRRGARSVRCGRTHCSRRPSSAGIWRTASRNGSDSMSPTVPPTSTIATSISCGRGQRG